MKTLNNEQGIVLIVAMIVMLILTIIGVAATRTSIYDTMTASAEQRRKAAFYAAEAGLEHARIELRDAKYYNNTTQTWNKNYLFVDHTEVLPEGPKAKPFLTGNLKLSSNESEYYSYKVYVSNNRDSTNYAAVDRDGLIFVRSESQRLTRGGGAAIGGGTANIEILLGSEITGSWTAQEKTGQSLHGSLKSNTSDDLNPIALKDFANPQSKITGLGVSAPIK